MNLANDIAAREPDRQRIAADMAAWEAQHGPVETMPPGHTSGAGHISAGRVMNDISTVNIVCQRANNRAAAARIPPKIRQMVMDEYATCDTLDTLAEKCGVTRRTLTRYAVHLGIERERK
jgi:hypothetical protein